MKRSLNIGIVTFPLGRAGVIAISNLIQLVRDRIDDLYIIGNALTRERVGNGDVRFLEVEHEHSGQKGKLTRLAKYIKTQLLISLKVLKISNKVDIYIFFSTKTNLIAPMFFAKLTNHKILHNIIGIGPYWSQELSKQASKSYIRRKIYHIDSILADVIILYSNSLMRDFCLNSYRKKLVFAYHNFIDVNKYTAVNPISLRRFDIGYVGRLKKVKGILNLIEAFKTLADMRTTSLLIAGDGPLEEEIKAQVSKGENGNIEYVGWMTHEEMPEKLNEIKILVIPSYTEGFPKIILEAMACGTVVLSSPVGAIPDIIKDGETGFIMEDNSPECIARNISRALNHPGLEQIAQNARVLVETEFTYEKAVERYREILSRL